MSLGLPELVGGSPCLHLSFAMISRAKYLYVES